MSVRLGGTAGSGLGGNLLAGVVWDDHEVLIAEYSSFAGAWNIRGTPFDPEDGILIEVTLRRLPHRLLPDAAAASTPAWKGVISV